MPPVASTTALRAEDAEAAALAVVAERARDAAAVLEQRDDRALHVDVDALVDAVVLQRADHLEAGAVADVREARIRWPPKLRCRIRPSVRAVEDARPRPRARARGRAPPCACSSAMRQLLTYWPPRIVSAKWTFQLSRSSTLAERRGDAALGHDGVRLAEQRLADQADRDAGRGGLDGGAQPGAAGADDEDVVLDASGYSAMLRGSSSRSRRPSSTAGRRGRRTRPQNRLHQAQSMCRRLRQLDAVVGRRARRAPRRSSSRQPPTRCRSEWQPKRVAAEQDDVERPAPACRRRCRTDVAPVAGSANQSAFQTS